MSAPTLRVALHSGILIRHDAISGSLRRKMEVLDRAAARGVPVELRAFVQTSDSADPRIVGVPSVRRLLSHPFFQDATVHVFEFGVWYPTFDVVHMLDPRTRSIGVYHNITPLELVPPDARPLIGRSLDQKENLVGLDHVTCDSEYNRDDLLAFGIPAERLSVLHLPPEATGTDLSPWWERHRARRGVVSLLFVGRFVRSKGVTDLITAAERAAERANAPLELVLAGNPALSDPDELDAIRSAARSGPLRGRIRIEQRPGTRTLARLYAMADVLVMPSYHEGYCIPVVEALAGGCRVVAYDAANLPHVVGDCGRLVPAGDVRRLADAIGETAAEVVAERGEAPVDLTADEGVGDRWRARVARHLAAFTAEGYERTFLRLLADVVEPVADAGPGWAAALRGAVPAGATT